VSATIREAALALIMQKRPIPFPIVVRYGLGEYRRGFTHGLGIAVALALVAALWRAWPW
jgi:hypothetical protein